MSDTLIFSINAVFPIIMLVLTGYILCRIGFFTDEFLKIGNKFVFSVCFFCMMFVNIYNVGEFDPIHKDVIVFAALAIIASALLGFFYVMFFVQDRAQKGVMLQAFYRSNFAIIGIPLAQSLYGNKGSLVATIILTVSIPLFNIFSVVFLTVFIKDKNGHISISKILRDILTNPLIDGIVAGMICLFIRPYLGGWTIKNSNFRFLYVSIENLSKVTSPFALVVLGGQFRFSSVKRLLPQISAGVLIRLIVIPILGLGAAHVFFPQFGGPEYAALLAMLGSPIAVASAIMATQMHNDGELANQLLVWTTLFSAVTIFCFIVFFRTIGIF